MERAGFDYELVEDLGEVGKVEEATSQGQADVCQGDNAALDYPAGYKLLEHGLRSWCLATSLAIFAFPCKSENMI